MKDWCNRVYQSGQLNRVASTATANYGYDANGNMTTKSEGKDLWRYGWNYENRLASTRKQTVRYRYDALGRRVQQYEVRGEKNTKFIYDGQDVLVDDNSGTLTKYINGQGIDNKLRQTTGTNINYFLSDHLGSTNGLTDANGNLTASTNYDSFGNATNTNFPNRYQFTGREYDSFTGLHYYRARFYDGNLGRFISEDPIGFAGGDVNLYGYTENNSLNFRDPSGKFIVPVIVGVVVVGGLILTSPSYVNAPGPGDPIYNSDNDLFVNAAGGAICGALFSKFVSPFLARILSGTGDDIIELGISQGGRKIVSEAIEVTLTGFDDVAGHVAKNGKLPTNFITKEEAKALGWKPKLGNLDEVAPGKSIGGNVFQNNEGLLPKANGRIWFEADINYTGGFRGNDRLLYSNDGLIFKTTDHYKTFIQIK